MYSQGDVECMIQLCDCTEKNLALQCKRRLNVQALLCSKDGKASMAKYGTRGSD